MSTALFEDNRKALEEYTMSEWAAPLLDSELFDLWTVATQSCRKEIRRLEKLLTFQVNGRIGDADERNTVIAKLNADNSILREALERLRPRREDFIDSESWERACEDYTSALGASKADEILT